MRHRLSARLPVGIALVAAALAGHAGLKLSRQPPDDARELVECYLELTPALPPSGRIGFLRTTAQEPDASRQYFLAQAALAPRIVDAASEEVQLVVSGPHGPATVAGFDLLATASNGARAYGRRGR